MNGFDSFVENRIQAQMSTDLTHEERSVIASLKLKNRSITEIATIIDRHRTTVWREHQTQLQPLRHLHGPRCHQEHLSACRTGVLPRLTHRPGTLGIR
jgi:IS30 family transposase